MCTFVGACAWLCLCTYMNDMVNGCVCVFCVLFIYIRSCNFCACVCIYLYLLIHVYACFLLSPCLSLFVRLVPCLSADPPSQDPVIAGYTPGQTLTSGDRLNCSVAGGNPLVSQVIFSCPNILPDQPDTSQSAAVFSSLTIPSTAMTDAVCTCRAEWSPKPQLYTRNTSIVISTNCNLIFLLRPLTL